MGGRAARYQNLDDLEKDTVQWYWRLIALTASWMVLGGYMIFPAAYDSDPKLRFSMTVLSVFIVALLTAGYSFTALLCFACRNWLFQAEAVFLPALTSSALGLLTVFWCQISSTRYTWGWPAIVATVLSSVSCIIYGGLLFLTNRKLQRIRDATSSRSAHIWQEQSFYNNYIANMYPTSRSPQQQPVTDDDMVNQQMAMLLMKSDPGPSPDASSATFRIDLPEDEAERRQQQYQGYNLQPQPMPQGMNRGRSPSLAERSYWASRSQREERGRREARSAAPSERAISREERRREIELGRIS